MKPRGDNRSESANLRLAIAKARELTDSIEAAQPVYSLRLRFGCQHERRTRISYKGIRRTIANEKGDGAYRSRAMFASATQQGEKPTSDTATRRGYHEKGRIQV